MKKEKKIIIPLTKNERFVAWKIWTGSNFGYFPLIEKKFLWWWVPYRKVELSGWENVYGLGSKEEVKEKAEGVKGEYETNLNL